MKSINQQFIESLKASIQAYDEDNYMLKLSDDQLRLHLIKMYEDTLEISMQQLEIQITPELAMHILSLLLKQGYKIGFSFDGQTALCHDDAHMMINATYVGTTFTYSAEIIS